MRKITMRFFVFATVAVLSASCLHAASVDEEKMRGLAAALTKVSAAVHVTVRYEKPSKDLSDAALLDLATVDQSSLLTAFDGYVLKAQQVGPNSSVLVCDGTGKTALIEDAGCTGDSDPEGQIWQTKPDHPCDYVLDLAATCP